MAAAPKSLIYQIQILGTDTAKLSMQELIDHQKRLKQLLLELPKAGTEAYDKLNKEIHDASGGAKSLESEVKHLTQSYKDSNKAISDFSNSLKDSSKDTEKAARAAEIAAQRQIAAEQKRSDRTREILERDAAKARQIQLSSSQDGLETLRQEEVARLQAQHEFSLLTLQEQQSLINAIDAKYAKANQKLAEKIAKENPAAGSINELRQELKKVNAELDNTAREIDGKVNPAFTELTQRANSLTQEVSQAEQASGRFQRNVGNYPDIGKSIKDTFENIGPSLIGAFAIGNVVELAISGLKTVLEVGSKFEKSISNLSAITGAAGDDLEYLRQKSIELGVSSTLGASQTAEAFKIVGSAKPDLLASTEALVGVTESVILLSQAATLELPESAKNLTDIMNQFQSAGETTAETVQKAKETVDILAVAAQAGSVEIAQTAEAVVKFGSGLSSLGGNAKTAIAIVQTLGPTIKGAEAGTAVKAILGRLASAGIGMKDGVLNVKSALEELAPIQNNVSELIKVFGRENFVVAGALIKNREQLEYFENALGKTGVAAEQARINMDNLAGDTAKLGARLEGLQITIFEQINDDARGATQTLSALIEFITVGLQQGLDDFLAPIKDQFALVKSFFSSIGNLITSISSIFGKASKDSNAFGTILKVLGGVMTALSLPFRALVKVVTWVIDGFAGAVSGIKGFIDSSPFLTKAIEVITFPLRTLAGVVSGVAGFFSDLFGPDKVAEVQSNAKILINTFGSLEAAGEALRNEFNASKEQYDEFVKGFDQKLLVGKNIAEARTIVEQEFKKFMDSTNAAQKELQEQSKNNLLEQVESEETALLERTAKGLEILRKRRKAQLAEEQGFADLSTGQQLLLLDRIDRDINAKKKALAGQGKKAEKDDEAEAIKALRERLQRQRDEILQGSEKGLEELRQQNLKKLEAEKGFAKLEADEQQKLRDGINKEIDDKLAAIQKKRADDFKTGLEASVKETVDAINTTLNENILGLEKTNFELNKSLDAAEQVALEAAGNHLGKRIKIQDDFAKKRLQLEEDLQEAILQEQLKAVEQQLQIADIGSQEYLALEKQANDLKKELYALDAKNLTDAEALKREQLLKTQAAQKAIVSSLSQTVNSITGIIQSSAENQIKAITALGEKQEAAHNSEIDRINKEYEHRKLVLQSTITNQFELQQAISQLDAQREASLAGVARRSAKEKQINDKRIADEQTRRQKAIAFQKKADALQILGNNAVTISESIKAVAQGAGEPFPANLVAIVSILAALASGLAQVRTLTMKYTQFEDGGHVIRAGGRSNRGMLHGRRHSAGGIIIEAEGGEYIANREATGLFHRHFMLMNEQGLRKRKGLPYTTDFSQILKTQYVPLPPIHMPKFKFASGGVVGSVGQFSGSTSGAIESGLENGFGRMVGLLEKIESSQRNSQVKLSLPELNRAQVKLASQEAKSKL